MNKEMEDFFDELEALVDSGGGEIKIGNKKLELSEIDAEAALVYLSMMETGNISKAMKNVTYFKNVIEMGREEMGLKEQKERIKKYARVLRNLPAIR